MSSLCSNKYNILSSLLATCGGLLFGYDMGIVSGALLQLKNEFDLSCTKQEIVVASMLMGAIIASLCGGLIIDKLGRRKAIFFASLLYFLGAAILAISVNYSLLIIGRMILGFAMSLASTAECVYVSEIAPAKIRGTLVSFNELGITAGILLSYCSNALFSLDEKNGWRWMFGVSGILAVILFCLTYILPTSPRFLWTQGRYEEAKMAFIKIRQVSSVTCNDTIENEWKAIGHNDNQKNQSLKSLFCGDNYIKYCVMIGIGMVIFQQSTGQPNMIFYASTILYSIGFQNETTAALCSVGLGVVKFLSTIICLIYIDKFGRRKFLLCGCAIMAFSLLLVSSLILKSGIGIIDSCNSKGNLSNVSKTVNVLSYSELPARAWMLLIAVMMFISAYSFSFGPITWLLLSEIFPTKIRGTAFSLTSSFNWIMQLLISLSFLDFANATGSVGWPFLFNSIWGIFAILFVFAFVPETKGKDLETIRREILQQKRKLPFCSSGQEISYELLQL